MMFSVLLFVVALALLNACFAVGTLKRVQPPSVRSLEGRSGLESIENGVVNWGNSSNSSTTAQNSAIVPVVLSDDGQYVNHIPLHV